MNKISGYGAFTLQNGTTVEMKFGTGSYELYGRAIGATTMQEIKDSMAPSKDAELSSSLNTLGNLRQFVMAGITYAALAQGKAVPFNNEWQVQEWMDEIGIDAIMDLIDKPVAVSQESQPAAGKKKAKEGIKPAL